MMRIQLLLLAAGLMIGRVQAQSNFWCATDQVSLQQMNNPALRNSHQALEQFASDYIKNNPVPVKRSSGFPVYVIPVVFHIVHNYGPENISDAQIFDEMRNLNRNYNGQRTDTAAVHPAFKNNIADVEIEFRLAQLDPNGNCTNGIVRHASLLTYNADNNSMINSWPQNQYLNIWTVASFNPALGGPGAYTFLPGVAPPGKDGIIALHNYVGSIGTSSAFTQYAITHECAHWFGVPHIWGTSNTPGVVCGDDGITDTPVTKGFNPCPNPNGAAICNPPIVENYQNYMDYSYCYYMFTNGQKAKMWAILNSPLRSNLYTLANHIATGIDGTNYTCQPVAWFDNRFPTMICEGASITFTQQSLNLDSSGNTFTWYANGAVPAVASGPQATFMYPTAGIYDVSLVVTNSAGTDSFAAPQKVVVSAAGPAAITLFSEGFESIAVPGAADWYVENEAAGSNAFVTTSATAFSGNSCIMLQNYSGNTAGYRDAFITPAFNLQNISAPRAYFRVAFAVKNTSATDALRISASTDCGNSWVLRYNRSAAQLKTVTNAVTVNFVPTAGSIDTMEWRNDMVNLLTYANQPNVRLKFEFLSNAGNNLFIDDINITGVVGLSDQLADASKPFLIPNPAGNQTVLHYTLSQPDDVCITLTDMAGRQVLKNTITNQPEGMHQYPIKNFFGKGVYLVQLVCSKGSFVSKVVFE